MTQRQRAADKLPDYVIRDIPLDIWDEFRSRAEAEGHSYRWVILALLKWYGDHGLPKGK